MQLLREQMEQAALELDFERAAALRDEIYLIEKTEE
ncbi:MAG: UvrB/UvrC motif-containing protein [archaeon]|nr:UvrB/UvrC motif-containing protein [archaeon]